MHLSSSSAAFAGAVIIASCPVASSAYRHDRCVALAVTSIACTTLILTGTFEQIVTLAALFFMLNYISTYAALIVLRIKEPHLPRPFRVVGYPFTSLVVLCGSVLFLIGAIVADPVAAVIAALLLVCGCAGAWPVDRWNRLRP